MASGETELGETLATLRIMLIEDDQAVGAALLRAIDRAGMQTAWASSGAEAMDMKPRFNPDVVLVDLELPDTSGIVLIKWLVDQRDCGVIVVSGLGDDADRIVGLELGADDYIAKPPNMRELVARIRAVHRRTGHVARPQREAQSFARGGVRLDCASRTVHGADGKLIKLTGAEFSTLETLFAAEGQVVTRDQLSQTALHRPWRAEDRSVDQLVLNLRNKLPLDADGQSLIQSVRGSGYLLRLV